jgi:hypothetical protein
VDDKQNEPTLKIMKPKSRMELKMNQSYWTMRLMSLETMKSQYWTERLRSQLMSTKMPTLNKKWK